MRVPAAAIRVGFLLPALVVIASGLPGQDRSLYPASFPEGTYEIRASLDGKKLGGAVPSRLTSNPVAVVVAPSAATASRGAAQRKCLAIDDCMHLES